MLNSPSVANALARLFRDASRGLGRAGTADQPGGPYMSMDDAANVFADLMLGGTGRNVVPAPALAAKCTASPDHADILETIENAADDWQAMGYATALAEVRDMANVGRALLEALPKGYHYMNCPSEIVSDLQNERDEAPARRFLKLVNRIADWTDDVVKVASPEQVRHVARVVRDGADPVYPPFGAPKSGDFA